MAGKKILTHLLFAGLLAGSMVIGQAQAAPFTMVCKSGGNMKLEIKTAYKGDGHLYWLHFKKASKGATARQPSSGQCAWTHRPLNNKERAYVQTHRIAKSKLAVEVTARGVKVSPSKVPSGIYKLLKYVKKPNKVFSMVVSMQKGLLYFDKVH